MKKKIIIIASIIICLIIAIVCMLKIIKAKDIDAYRQVGEYYFKIYDEEGIWYCGSEKFFLKYCEAEEVRTIVEEDIYVQMIEMINADTVLILREPWFWGMQGYIIVRNGEELPYEKITSYYEDAEYKPLGDGVYTFKWCNVPN